MKSESELVAAAHLSYIGSFRKLVEQSPAGAIHVDDRAFTFVTGLMIPTFNGCVVTQPIAAGELTESLDWLSSRGLPYEVSIAEPLAPELADVVMGSGLSINPVPYPGMALHPVPPSPPLPPDVVVARGLEPGLADYLPASFAADPDVRVFNARLDGRPVGISIAIRTGDVAGVYGVGTRPESRGRGVGTAVTWAAVAAGREWGSDTIVLQASEMGLSLYQRMGFRTVVRYVKFLGGVRRPVQPDD